MDAAFSISEAMFAIVALGAVRLGLVAFRIVGGALGIVDGALGIVESAFSLAQSSLFKALLSHDIVDGICGIVEVAHSVVGDAPGAVRLEFDGVCRTLRRVFGELWVVDDVCDVWFFGVVDEMPAAARSSTALPGIVAVDGEQQAAGAAFVKSRRESAEADDAFVAAGDELGTLVVICDAVLVAR